MSGPPVQSAHLHSDATRLLGEEQRLAAASAARLQLERQVEQVGQDIRRLKMTYDSLREEFTLREKKVRIQSLNRAVARTSKDEEQRWVQQKPSDGSRPEPLDPPPLLSQSSRSQRACAVQARWSPSSSKSGCRP